MLQGAQRKHLSTPSSFAVARAPETKRDEAARDARPGRGEAGGAGAAVAAVGTQRQQSPRHVLATAKRKQKLRPRRRLGGVFGRGRSGGMGR